VGIGEWWAYKLGTGFPVSVRSSVLEGAEGHGPEFCSPMPTKGKDLRRTTRRRKRVVSTLGHLAAYYHGIHVAPLRDGHEVLHWRPRVPRFDRVRVREHTCECEPLTYEFCSAGGVAFIRRRRREGKKVTLRETEWLLTAEGERLWTAILTGWAC